jgi:hypothetical protein
VTGPVPGNWWHLGTGLGAEPWRQLASFLLY